MGTDVQVEELHCRIVTELEAHQNPENVELAGRYHKVEGFVAYGLSTQKLREVARSFRPAFKELALEQRLDLAMRLIISGIEEQAFVANELLILSAELLTAEHLPWLDGYVEHFRTWSTTDGFCLWVLQPVLRNCREETLALLRKWNESENLWKRRASVVAFVRKIGASGAYTDEALALCENLLWDPEDLVLKGVGWALKDVLHGDKAHVVEYVKELRKRGVSSVITLYAIRDLKGAERADVLAVKKGK